MKQILLLLLISFSLTAQVNGVVLDSISGKPIAYVNIWVENENIGTTSEENGVFSLDIKEEKNIIFSALGYETKTIKSTEIKQVYLKAIVYEMEEIVLEIPKLTKEIQIKRLKTKTINHVFTSKSGIFIYAKFFPKKINYNETKFIKNVKIKTNSNIKNAKFKLRLYSTNEYGFPSSDLIEEDIIVTVKKGKKTNTIDLSKYKLLFPENGFFVAYECLKIESNKYRDNSKQENEFYEPGFESNIVNEEQTYYFIKGKWEKSEKSTDINIKGFDNKIFEPAIELTLTN
ncbi:carboxypeptidase-like regulatory domain-containing protein [Flavobacterium sp.]|uniref:carboxypeptidase-like regulatory domain-containing protein n=1 Tax=Flavobacterium sp. TaxID=239 RepID=UPI003F699F98